MKTVEEILEEYKHADRVKCCQMWIWFIELRDQFDEIDCNSKNLRQGIQSKELTGTSLKNKITCNRRLEILKCNLYNQI